jgi:hypothetical protein
MMPYWGVLCLWCEGEIVDALLECVPREKRSSPAFRLLSLCKPGAALACPYCNRLIAFDEGGNLRPPLPGWPIFRYGRNLCEAKKLADGESAATALAAWALQYRFMNPGTHLPLTEYTYAEDAPEHDFVP